MKFKSTFAQLLALSLLSTACMEINSINGVKVKKSSSNRVTQDSSNVNTVIGDKDVQIQVISQESLNEAISSRDILAPSDIQFKASLNSLAEQSSTKTVKSNTERNDEVTTSEKSLLIGFPLGLLGEQNIFGGVITKVSDAENESIGNLKLTDLPPMHVRPVLQRDEEGNFMVLLVGCVQKCSENSQPAGLLALPVVGLNQATDTLILDMSAFGKDLNMMSFQDPTGEATKLQTVSNETVSVEYDLKTLVFDIKTSMIPLAAPAKAKINFPAPAIPDLAQDDLDIVKSNVGPVVKEMITLTDLNEPKVTEITTRWYLKLNSGSNPAFESRSPTPGVGYFTTMRSQKANITRFASTEKVKYFVKNVPEAYKSSFAKAFENWNEEFRKILGRDYLTYEFIDETDPRNALVVTGDIRYNIIEWDLHNNASYDGLGPSIANQYSGEILSGTVLIQGPNIIKQYAYWYHTSGRAVELKKAGKIEEANKLMKAFNQKMAREAKARTQTKYSLNLNDKLSMNIAAQRDDLKDEVVKGHFEIVPEGVSLADYLDSYIAHVVTHEIGHNLGLRHNFKGNLGAHDHDEKKVVSRSIMEYLGPEVSYLNNAIGDYDRMAIAYGYMGIAPTNLDWFCTDEDQFTNRTSLSIKSPECSKSDATSDPFSFWEKRLDRSLDLILEKKSNTKPVWTFKEVAGRVDTAVIQLAHFAMSAEKTADKWTSFFGKEGRPTSKEEVKDYVVERLKLKVCDHANFEVVMAKENEEAQDLAKNNLVAFMQQVVGRLNNLGLVKAADFKCEE